MFTGNVERGAQGNLAAKDPVIPPANSINFINGDAKDWPGGKFPTVRQCLFTTTELNALDCQQIRYAINEIYARHGYWFYGKDAEEKRKPFLDLSWYHPDIGKNDRAIEAVMTSVKKENIRLLADHRLPIFKDFNICRAKNGWIVGHQNYQPFKNDCLYGLVILRDEAVRVHQAAYT